MNREFFYTPSWVTGGDCFVRAFEKIFESKDEFNWKLVHGWVIATWGIAKGKYILHAWVETPDGVVIDNSNNNNVVDSKKKYYDFFSPLQLVKYSREEAVRLHEQTKHYGPWDTNW